jgi:hypothetical protein
MESRASVDNFRERVYRIPANLDRKFVFTEVAYCTKYLHLEKQYMEKVVNTVGALERFYRTSAQSFLNNSDIKARVPPDLPQTGDYQQFLLARQRMCQRYVEMAAKLKTVQDQEFTQLTKFYDDSRKQFKIDLKNLEAMLKPSLEALYQSMSGYDKYFKQLQSQSVMKEAAQARKAVNSLDEKLGRVQNYYAEFHRKFVEYCAARQPIFNKVEFTVLSVNDNINALLMNVGAIEGIPRTEPGQGLTASDSREDLRDLWDEEEDAKEPAPFALRTLHALKIGDSTIQRDEKVTLLEYRGDIWKVRDANGKTWCIPQIYLGPDGGK